MTLFLKCVVPCGELTLSRCVNAIPPRESMIERHRKRLKEAFRSYLPLPLNLEPHLRDALCSYVGGSRQFGSYGNRSSDISRVRAVGCCRNRSGDRTRILPYCLPALRRLPSMDDASERRGVPCAHLEFGDAGAILAALALVNRAYALTWRSVSACLPERRSQGLAYVEQHLGLGGLLNGQSMDLHYSMLPHNHETTEKIAMGKRCL
jgi:geranylgeranyl diphosphate synthase, type II